MVTYLPTIKKISLENGMLQYIKAKDYLCCILEKRFLHGEGLMECYYVGCPKPKGYS